MRIVDGSSRVCDDPVVSASAIASILAPEPDDGASTPLHGARVRPTAATPVTFEPVVERAEPTIAQRLSRSASGPYSRNRFETVAILDDVDGVAREIIPPSGFSPSSPIPPSGFAQPFLADPRLLGLNDSVHFLRHSS